MRQARTGRPAGHIVDANALREKFEAALIDFSIHVDVDWKTRDLRNRIWQIAFTEAGFCGRGARLMFVEFSPMHSYSLLPVRFARIPVFSARVLMTSEAGEYIFLSTAQFEQLLAGHLSDEPITRDIEAKHFIYQGDPTLALRLLAAKLRTRKSFLRGSPSLHICVVALR